MKISEFYVEKLGFVKRQHQHAWEVEVVFEILTDNLYDLVQRFLTQ